MKFIEQQKMLKARLKDNQKLIVCTHMVSLPSLREIGEVRKRGCVYYSSAIGQGFRSPIECAGHEVKMIKQDRKNLTEVEAKDLIDLLQNPVMLYLNSNSDGPKQFDFADRLLSAGARFRFLVYRETYKVTKHPSGWMDYETVGREEVISFDNFKKWELKQDDRRHYLYMKWHRCPNRGRKGD